MRQWFFDLLQFFQFGRAARTHFFLQVFELKPQLPARYREFRAVPWKTDFPRVKTVFPRTSLAPNVKQVSPDRRDGPGRAFESFKLGMVFVAARLALQDFLCEQGFPPQGHQAFSVQVLWVNAPESHGLVLDNSRIKNDAWKARFKFQ
jgi:hypothetical protein